MKKKIVELLRKKNNIKQKKYIFIETKLKDLSTVYVKQNIKFY